MYELAAGTAHAVSASSAERTEEAIVVLSLLLVVDTTVEKEELKPKRRGAMFWLSFGLPQVLLCPTEYFSRPLSITIMHTRGAIYLLVIYVLAHKHSTG